MTLFQTAFSHNSFSPPGGVRSVVADGKCAGPILITHSVKDEAVGRNGARHTPEASHGDLLPEGAPYTFAPGRIYTLQADDIIQARSDIVKPETAWALISAAGLDRARLARL